MRGFFGFTKRNLLLYFKDVQTVVFSLLTSIIVFGLYLLFLKGNYVDVVQNSLKGLENFVSDSDVEMLVNGILLTGILGSALITVPFNCLTTIVKDKEQKIDFDISATPMKRWQIVLSYFLSAGISAIIITSAILTIGLLVLNQMGDTYLSKMNILELYGLIVLGSFVSTALFMIVMQFFKSSSASGAFFGILSAASGFIIGAYIPLSEFSDSIQTVCNLVPETHITILIRRLLLGGVLDKMNEDIGGVDKGLFVSGMKDAFSFNSNMFGEIISSKSSLIYILSFLVISLIVMTVLYKFTYKRK